MTTYCVKLDVPRNLIFFVAGLLRQHRKAVGTRRGTRKLTCYRQAVFTLAWMRDGVDIERLGAGFGLSRSTAYEYHAEALGEIAKRGTDLVATLERALRDGTPYLILDGTVVECNRLDEKKVSSKGNIIDSWYSGKCKLFGGNVQLLTDPSGVPLWTSEVWPGSFHDITVARAEVLQILQPYLKDLPILADGGYVGAGHGVYVPVPQPKDGTELPIDVRSYNKALRGLRAQGERGFALLFGRWKALRHVTMSPRSITSLMRVAVVLTQFEHKIIM